MNMTSPDSEFSKKLLRQLYWVAIQYALLAIVSIMTLVAIALELTLPQIRALAMMTPIGGSFNIGIDLLSVYWLYRPLRAYFQAGSATPERQALAQDAYTRALNLPMFTAIRVLTLHAFTGYSSITAGVLWINTFLEKPIPFGPAMLVVSSAYFLAVIAHAILEYFAVQRAVRPTFPDGNPTFYAGSRLRPSSDLLPNGRQASAKM